MTIAPESPRASPCPATPSRAIGGPGPNRVVDVAGGVVAAAVIVAVFVAVGDAALWLDEAQTVAIARLPVADLLDALRGDGAPPLYYVLLHGWIAVVGDGAVAVRALSLVAALATLPVAWRAGAALAGREGARVAMVLAATSPFVLRYASEARMYSIVVLLAFAGIVAVDGALRCPSRRRLAAVAVLAAALVLTHYWGLFAVVATAAVIALGRGRHRVRVLAALVVGALPFLLWLPAFVFQASRTGAPWAPAPGVAVVDVVMRGFAGATTDAGRLVSVLLVAMVGAALLAPSAGGRRARVGSALGAATVATLALAASVTWIGGEGVAARHAAVVLPPVLLLATSGALSMDRRARVGLTAVVAAAGVVAGASAATAPRTQAEAIARVIGSPGPRDVVVACPDQLAPGLHRARPDVPVRAVPGGSPPDRVDWTDYRARVATVAPGALAAELHRRTVGTIWLVWSSTYRLIGPRCGQLHAELVRLRPGGATVVRADRDAFERAAVWRG